MTHPIPTRRRARRHPDPLAAYRFALDEGDTRLADLLHRRLVARALAARIVRTLQARLGAHRGSPRQEPAPHPDPRHDDQEGRP